MADYWISFRVKSEGNHSKRYSDMIDVINEHATGVWDTDTSFLAIRSGSSIDEIG